jgi:hypothetical protein
MTSTLSHFELYTQKKNCPWQILHSNSKFRVSATVAFWKTTFTEVSSSKILPKASGFRTETLGFRTETSSFLNRNFGFFEPKLRVFRTETSGFRTKFSCVLKPKFRVFKPRLCVWIFCDRNFGISNPCEDFSEVSVELKPDKFSKSRAKMNNCSAH